MANFGGKNRIELESQILCAALRQSWADTDATGMVKSCLELSTIFPDLLPPPSPQVTNPSNYYDVLEIDCDVNTPKIIAAYFKAVKKFLRENPKPRNLKDEYYRLLNAGFILRRPRSRLSHDLIVVRGALLDSNIIPEDGTLKLIEPPTVEQQTDAEPVHEEIGVAEPAPAAEETAVAEPVHAEEEPDVEEIYEETEAPPVEPEAEAEQLEDYYEDTAEEAVPEFVAAAVVESDSQIIAPSVEPADEPTVEIAAPKLPQEEVPLLIELLLYTQYIGQAEVQALQNQTQRFPDIALVDLVLHSGYVSVPEMKSLLLAEFLITSGKMTLPQFRAILDEKRTWLDLYYPFKG